MLSVQRPTPQQRALSLLLAALLHAALLFALLHFMVVTPKRSIATAPEHFLEMIISTAKKPVPVTGPAPQLKRPPSRSRRGGEYYGPMPSFTPPVAPPDITGFGQAIFGCAPENMPNLTPDQRAHCTNGFTRPDDSALNDPRSHVKDPLRRAAEMGAENAPTHVPCGGFRVGGGTEWLGLDLGCVAKGAFFGKGFAPLNGLEK